MQAIKSQDADQIESVLAAIHNEIPADRIPQKDQGNLKKAEELLMRLKSEKCITNLLKFSYKNF